MIMSQDDLEAVLGERPMAKKGMVQAPVVKIGSVAGDLKLKVKSPQKGSSKHVDKVKKGGKHPVGRD